MDHSVLNCKCRLRAKWRHARWGVSWSALPKQKRTRTSAHWRNRNRRRRGDSSSPAVDARSASTREKHRVAVNAWIRESGAFDGVADFDAALHDPEIPTQRRAVDDCGDGLPPSDGGYCKMGDAIDLALFDWEIDGLPGIVDEQPRAGRMDLPHGWRQPALPLLVELAEARVAITPRAQLPEGLANEPARP